MGKLKKGKDLYNYAEKIGVAGEGDLITQSSSGRRPRADDATLQKRVRDEENHGMQKKLLIIAWFGLFFSIIAALTGAAAVFIDLDRNGSPHFHQKGVSDLPLNEN